MTKQVRVFESLFREHIEEVFEEYFGEFSRTNKEKIAFCPLPCWQTVLCTGDYLININEYLQAIGLFGETDLSVKSAIYPVLQKSKEGKSYIKIEGENIFTEKLDTEEYIVIPSLKNFYKKVVDFM